jgi:hypothetical protein
MESMRAVKATLLSLGVCLGLIAAQAGTLTVDEVVSFVRSSIQLKQSDKSVADYLRKVTLSQKLEDRTIEDLQAAGVGPKTLVALHDLRDASAKLSAPPPVVVKPAPPPIPPPSDKEQDRILGEVKEYALNYTKNLPNFICTEVIRRSLDRDGSGFWGSLDTIATQLTYFEQKEQYGNLFINGKMSTDKKFENLGGATSSGEFGSMMKELFEPETQATFKWDHWGVLRGRQMYVFSYYVEQSHSKWHIDYQRQQDIVPAYSGLIYVDKDASIVHRITLKAEGIPAAFPVQAASTMLDYELVKIADREFMLPLRAEVYMTAVNPHTEIGAGNSRVTIPGKYLTKNEEEFRLYKKYSAESTILPDVPPETPAPLPDSETKEKPGKP